jgi:uncharacterized damage-inducible protein DinB
MKNPISLETINEQFDFNYWARDRQLQVCSELSSEQLTRHLGGSFKNLHNTLVHLVVVEWLWLERWLGNTPYPIPRAKEFPSLESLVERWTIEEKRMRSYLSGLVESDLEKEITCFSTNGEKWSYPLWHMMMHLLNHQSFHRGQVTFCFRQLGVKPVKIDFLDGLGMEFKIS